MLRAALAALIVVSLPAPAVAQAPDPAALFDQGATWDEFLANVRAREELWRTNTARAEPTEDMVGRLKAAGDGLRFLVIAVDTCSDSVSTIPYLATLAARAGVDLRIVNSRIGRSIMERHRTPDDRAATPTVVLLRGQAQVAVFIERPAALQDWYLSARAQALPIDERVRRKMAWYDWDRGDSTLEEIVALAERDTRARAPHVH